MDVIISLAQETTKFQSLNFQTAHSLW